jgi:magnesium transporter
MAHAVAAPSAPRETIFHGTSFRTADRSYREFGAADLRRELADAEVFSWIDVQAADAGALRPVLDALGLGDSVVERFDAPEILPHLVERPDGLAFYLYEIEDPGRHLDTRQAIHDITFGRLLLVLGRKFVLTFHSVHLDAVDEVKASCAESFRLAGRSPAFIAFLFLQRCLYDYAHLNLANDNYLDGIEAAIERGNRDVLDDDVPVAGGNILTLKKLTASLQIVLMRLGTRRSAFVTDEARGSFQEMLANAGQIRAAIDSSRDLLSGILAAVQAQAAERTSEIARVLTVMSGVLLPLTLISGIYGMNFENMPELGWRLGYPAALGVMVVVGNGLVLVFRRLGWLERPRRGG